MKKVEWVFYYTTDNGNEFHFVGEGSYIKPDRTKLYKETGKFLGKANVHSVGYKLKSLYILENIPTSTTL